MNISRRTVVQGMVAGLTAAGVPAGARILAQILGGDHPFRIWDGHSHLYQLPGNTAAERMEVLVRHMDRLGVERLILSQGYDDYVERAKPPTRDQVRLENDRVMNAVRAFPDRAYGSLYVNPDDEDFSLQEFNRCVRDGPMVMIGELETDILCNSPKLDPIVERAVSMNVPILQHCWIKTKGNDPGESTPADLVELARRHPQAQFICGHTGGNWELGIRTIRDVKNICADIAGSDPTSGFVEMAVRELGAERVIYGSDVGGRTFASQLGKVLGAEISDADKELILGGNLRRLLLPSLREKGLAS
jgi:uncharacterized protein